MNFVDEPRTFLMEEATGQIQRDPNIPPTVVVVFIIPLSKGPFEGPKIVRTHKMLH